MNTRAKNERRPHVRVHGFNLMEMVIVIAIIALLAGIAVPNVMKRLEQAKINAAKTTIVTLTDAVNQFQIDMNRMPNTMDELFQNSGGDKKWGGPYIKNYKSMPKDPWGNDYVFTVKDGSDFEILSYGKNGQSGGGDDVGYVKED